MQSKVQDARRHGVKSHKVVCWVRRKLGSDMIVWRLVEGNKIACASPCIMCQKELLRFDMKVHCLRRDGSWFSGRLSDQGAPEAVLTSGQRRNMCPKQSKAKNKMGLSD